VALVADGVPAVGAVFAPASGEFLLRARAAAAPC